MAARTFVITEDHIDTDAVTPVPPCFRPKGTKFRLYDDDGILYYTGYAADEVGALVDAWEWGAAYAGATYQEILVEGTGNWEISIG